MVRHIVCWKLKSEFTPAEAAAAKTKIKTDLEALVGVVDGLTKLVIHTEGLHHSSADLMIYSEFVDAAALDGYQVHPEHQKAAAFVRASVENRLAFDFEC